MLIHQEALRRCCFCGRQGSTLRSVECCPFALHRVSTEQKHQQCEEVWRSRFNKSKATRHHGDSEPVPCTARGSVLGVEQTNWSNITEYKKRGVLKLTSGCLKKSISVQSWCWVSLVALGQQKSFKSKLSFELAVSMPVLFHLTSPAHFSLLYRTCPVALQRDTSEVIHQTIRTLKMDT